MFCCTIPGTRYVLVLFRNFFAIGTRNELIVGGHIYAEQPVSIVVGGHIYAEQPVSIVVMLQVSIVRVVVHGIFFRPSKLQLDFIQRI